MDKEKCFNEIKRAIEHAKECGITVVVGSDPEGNNWNSINPLNMVYGETKEGYIALGVWDGVDESEVFKNICLGPGCEVELPDNKNLCEKCKDTPGLAWLNK